MRSKVGAAFTLTGSDLDPDHVTALVGIPPSKTWKTGDRISERTILRYQHCGWSIKSDLPASADLEDHVRDLLEKLEPGWEPLVDLGARYDAEIACVVYSYGGARPAIHFGSDVVKRIAELNAAIDVDLFVMP